MWSRSRDFFRGEDPAAAFLACRWHELFDEYSPDTFQPKLFSLPSLVSEVVEIAQLQAQHEAWGKHRKSVQDEIGERLERGLETRLCHPRHLGMLKTLAKSPVASEVIGLGRVLELENFAGAMEDALIKAFRSLDLSTVSSRKVKADMLLTTLATYAFRRGCSGSDCTGIDARIQSGPEGVREWIIACLPTKKLEFDCIVAVETGEDAMIGGIRAVCEHAKVTRASPKLIGRASEKGVLCFRRHDYGMRASDAITTLKADIDVGLSLLALYKQAAAPVILEGGWVENKGVFEYIPEADASFRNLHPRRDAASLAKHAVGNLTNKNRNEPALRAALDLHNLALSMTDHRLRLVNLWSALECIGSLVEGGSIISRVENLVAPILTWRKVDKITRYLAINLHFWLVDNPDIDRNSLPFRLGHMDSVAPEQILPLLTEAENSSGISSLLGLVGDHPLLCHRIYRAWKLFHDPEKLAADLKRSQSRLGWHLWRIYRARNLLVHQGIEPKCLPQLANHLQQYFSWTISRLLHGLARSPEWTARDSWHFWKSKADHLTATLTTEPQLLVMGDVFPEDLHNPNQQIYPRNGWQGNE